MTETFELQCALSAHFGGSDAFWRHAMNRRFLYSEGVKTFLDNAGNGAYWLADLIALDPDVMRACEADGMHMAVLAVSGSSATLTVSRDLVGDDDNGALPTPVGIVTSRHIDYTDCPSGVWRFYLAPTFVTMNDDRPHVMMMLPNEY